MRYNRYDKIECSKKFSVIANFHQNWWLQIKVSGAWPYLTITCQLIIFVTLWRNNDSNIDCLTICLSTSNKKLFHKSQWKQVIFDGTVASKLVVEEFEAIISYFLNIYIVKYILNLKFFLIIISKKKRKNGLTIWVVWFYNISTVRGEFFDTRTAFNAFSVIFKRSCMRRLSNYG